MKVLSRQIILITPISASFTHPKGYERFIACVKIECSEKYQLAESKAARPAVKPHSETASGEYLYQFDLTSRKHLRDD
jgi:hypothetical protein